MQETLTIPINSITELDRVARAISQPIVYGDLRPYIMNVIGSPNSGKSTLANQIARQIAQSQHFAQSKHFDSQYGRAWHAWKSASPKRLIRRIDSNASRVERLHNPPIPSLGKYDIDIWENSSYPSDIQIDIKNIGHEKREITITSTDKNFVAALKMQLISSDLKVLAP